VNARLRTGSWLFAALALVAAVPAAAQGRYSVSPDGNEVADATTHLVWRRCAEGMRWNGRTCEGKLAKFFYHEAKQHAADSGAHWRLPTRDELVSIVAKGKKKPMIDGAAFPNTLAPRADHLVHALWLGTPLALKADVLPETVRADEESPVVPNT